MVAAAAGAFAIGSGAFSGAAPVGVPTFSRVVRLTSSAAREMAPAISPDGKWVAYLSDARGTFDVWVQFIGGGQSINLTEKANIVLSSRSVVGGLEISPDGSRILFVGGPTDTTSNSTYSVPAPLGGVPSLFLRNGIQGVRWSPDGSRIAYVLAGGSAGDAIWTADADGSDERPLARAEGNLHKHWPSWSADGQYIYFSRSMTAWNAAPTEVYRVAVTGGSPELVVASASRAAFAAAAPDGRGLIYAADPVGSELNLWWRPLTGGGSVRLTTGVGEYAQPRISLDGQTMVCTLLETRDSLVRVDLGSDPGSTSASTPLTDGYTGDLDPNLSRSGDRLVFSSTRSGQRNLWIARSDLTDSRPLTSGPSLDEYPQFSPDGQQVAFISNRGGERGLWIVSADGGVPRRLSRRRLCSLISRGRRTGARSCIDTSWRTAWSLGHQRWRRAHSAFAEPDEQWRYLASMVTDGRRDCLLGREAEYPGQPAGSGRGAIHDQLWTAGHARHRPDRALFKRLPGMVTRRTQAGGDACSRYGGGICMDL